MSKRIGSTTMIAGAMASAIGFYTLSLHVSAERSDAERLQARIAADLRDIRALEAELRTRARLPVLQQWNDNVLAMSAPTSKQFVDSPVQLASYAPNAPAAAPAEASVQLAVITPDTPALPTPGLVKAAYQVPAAPIAYAAPAPRIEPPKPVAKIETAKAEPKPAVPVKLADAKPKPTLAGLDALAGAIDNAAAAERGGGFRKVSMQ